MASLFGTVSAALSGVTICSDIIDSGLVITRYGPWRVKKKRPGSDCSAGALYSTNSGPSILRLHAAMMKKSVTARQLLVTGVNARSQHRDGRKGDEDGISKAFYVTARRRVRKSPGV